MSDMRDLIIDLDSDAWNGISQDDRIEAKLDRILAILEKPTREVKAKPAVYFDEWWKAYPNKANKKKALEL